MSLEFDATYRDGALHPAEPLNLPNNAPVRVVILPAAAPLAIPPTKPLITAEEFDAIVEKHSFSAPPLPENFSRADIYSDHD
jgi:hypothetical protein